MEYIVTCNKDYGKLAVHELQTADPSFQLVCWLDEGVGLGASQLEPHELARLAVEVPVIFVRHMFAVTAVTDYGKGQAQIEAICRERLDQTLSFCVQTRYAVGEEKDLHMTEALSQTLVKEGFDLDVASGAQIVSLYGAQGKYYVGVGPAQYNISHWKGGMPHYSYSDAFQFISRAEYKLKEALEHFAIDLHPMKRAADLGAAPGGWTKVLSDGGLEVSSIDPSRLNPVIEKRPNVRYYHMTVEEYLTLPLNDTFDIVVNDMKMDVAESMAIIQSFHDRITPGGVVVMTLKLPREFSYKDLRRQLDSLMGFERLGCRQLFHNRSEVTAVWKQKPYLPEEAAAVSARKPVRFGKKPNAKKTPQKKGQLSKKLMRKYGR